MPLTKPMQMPMRLMRGLPVLFAALAVGAVAASPAAATFGAPLDLSKAGQNARNPQVAVDADGDAVFTWERFDGANWRVQTRVRSAAGALSPVQTLSTSGRDALDPQVAVDADGDAVFTWRRSDGANDRAQARARSAAGALSAVQDLSDAGQDASQPQVAVDADGDAVFTWRRSDGANDRAQARARSAGGALGAVQDLSAAGQNAFNPKVAVRPTGGAVFTWQRFDGADFRAQARARSAAGALSAVQTLSSSGQNAFVPQVAVEAGGDAVFTWARFDGADFRAQGRARSAAGALSAVQTLSSSGQSGSNPRVAVDADGDAVFTWERFDGANVRAQARARSAAGALSAVQDLSPGGQNAFEPQVAVDADGDAVFAWKRLDHPGVDVIQARERTAAGALFAVQTLSDAGQSAAQPRVAVDADGDAVSVWVRSDGASDRIQVATGP